MNAADLHRRILLSLSTGDVRLFRNNTGLGWVGAVRHGPGGLVIIEHARPLHAGLCEGSADLIGWRSVTITPKMVGARVAVFAAVEAKTGSGRLTDQQEAFLLAVAKHGGLAGMATSVQEAQEVLAGNGFERGR